MVPKHYRKSGLDCIPDHPLRSDLVTRLKNALDVGDKETMMDILCAEVAHVDATIELSNDDWMKSPTAQLHPLVLVGLWSLEYKRELTNPLCISASHGHTACLRHLLFWRADPNAAPGGQSALHEACKGGHTDCVVLLLEHRANPNFLSDDGLAPLHLCTGQNSFGCAKALVTFGALVNQPSEDSQETPLHIAAKHCLPEHVRLYLRNGATVDLKNSMAETALSVACGEAKKKECQESYLRVCQLLLTYGAEVNSVDGDMKSPLHKACKNAHHSLVLLLLQRHADVLKSCASVPEIIEILCNSYPHLPITEKWMEAIPKEDFERHRPFYESLINQMYTVQTLQHLCRCAVRTRLGRSCHCLVPLLPVPTSLQSYLLLEPEGVVL